MKMKFRGVGEIANLGAMAVVYRILTYQTLARHSLVYNLIKIYLCKIDGLSRCFSAPTRFDPHSYKVPNICFNCGSENELLLHVCEFESIRQSKELKTNIPMAFKENKTLLLIPNTIVQVLQSAIMVFNGAILRHRLLTEVEHLSFCWIGSFWGHFSYSSDLLSFFLICFFWGHFPSSSELSVSYLYLVKEKN